MNDVLHGSGGDKSASIGGARCSFGFAFVLARGQIDLGVGVRERG